MLAGIAIIVLIGLVGAASSLLVAASAEGERRLGGEIGLLFSGASAVYTVVGAVVARLGERSATLGSEELAALLRGLTIILVLISASTVAAVAFVLLRAPPWSTMDTIIYPLAAAGAHRSALGRGSVMGLVMLGWAAASTVGPIAGAIADSSGMGGLRGDDRVLRPHRLWLLEPEGLGAAVDGRSRATVRRSRPRCASQGVRPDRVRLRRGRGRGDALRVARCGRRGCATAPGADARVLDAGAGTGLLGGALARAGFRRLDALDMSSGMLDQAAAQGVYRDLRVGRLDERLDYETGSYDGVVSAGVLTTGHAPATSLEARPRDAARGPVIFTPPFRHGAPGIRREDRRAERSRRWELVDRGDEFQALPKGEPEVLVARVGVSRAGRRSRLASSASIFSRLRRIRRRSRPASPWKFVTTQHRGVVVDRVREAEAVVDDRAEAREGDARRARKRARREDAPRACVVAGSVKSAGASSSGSTMRRRPSRCRSTPRPSLQRASRRDVAVDCRAEQIRGVRAPVPPANRADEGDALVGDGAHCLRPAVQEALRVDRLVRRRGLPGEREEGELERHLHERVRAHSVPDDRALAQLVGVGTARSVRPSKASTSRCSARMDRRSSRVGRTKGLSSEVDRGAGVGRRIALVLDEQLRKRTAVLPSKPECSMQKPATPFAATTSWIDLSNQRPRPSPCRNRRAASPVREGWLGEPSSSTSRRIAGSTASSEPAGRRGGAPGCRPRSGVCRW